MSAYGVRLLRLRASVTQGASNPVTGLLLLGTIAVTGLLCWGMWRTFR
jgi:hypothetical protein